ncbi:MAG: hypothetical protein ACO3SP_02605 [Ilumatobacteraceae bacterium]
MGQPVVVTEKPSRRPGVVRYEANRSLSGMGHESFHSGDQSAHLQRGTSSSAELARRLFATGRVAGVHVYQNMITVDLVQGRSPEGLGDIVRDLYQYWKPGMAPPSFEDLVPAEEPVGSDAGGSADGAAAVDSRVPAHLVERAQQARARWNAR